MSTKATLPNILDYPQYISLVKALVNQGKTSGADQSEEMIYYTGLNLGRMERIKKTFHFTEELSRAVNSIGQAYKFVVLTEAWCGEAAQLFPVLGAVCGIAVGQVVMQFLSRYEHLEMIDLILSTS